MCEAFRRCSTPRGVTEFGTTRRHAVQLHFATCSTPLGVTEFGTERDRLVAIEGYLR